MRLPSVHKSQQSQRTLRRLGPAGSWVLPAGHAVTLDVPDDAALRITQGRVWATFDGPHQGPANDQGDVVLAAGERLALHAGQRVVIEPWSSGGTACAAQGAYFSLEASAQA
jgi:hypothetical protein